MRGRTRNKGPNPLTRSFESNGPDVKIRGTAQHIADKYAQLARDSTVSGDPVSAENYHQHAEHYYRMIATAQEQYRLQYGTQQRFDEDGDEDGDDGQGGVGYGERGGPGMANGDDYGDGPGQAQAYDVRPQAQPYEARGGDRPQQPRYDRNDRGGADRGGPDRGYDRGQDRGPDRPQDRGGDRGPDRAPDRGQRYDRPGGDRPDRANGQGPERADRNGGGDRYDRPPQAGRDQRFANRPDNRNENGPRREFPRPDRPPNPPRHEPRFAGPTEEARDAGPGNLPAFLTNPVRSPITTADEDHRGDDTMPLPAMPYIDDAGDPTAVNGAEARPRRRRAARRPDAETLDFAPPSETGDKSID